jgi:hypothetical protein
MGVTRGAGRPIKLFRLSDWAWVDPRLAPFVLFVAANASVEKKDEILQFAADAVESGCGCVCTWGKDCSFVHDLFDWASIDADRDVDSTWWDDKSLAWPLWWALDCAYPDESEFPDAYESGIVLAVEEPWLAEVRRLVADQEELVRLALDEDL